MAATLTIRDETLGNTAALHEWALEVLTERLTVRELIRSRVYQEVQDHNRRQSPEFRGLVQPEGAERTPNGWRLKAPRAIDWKQQFAKALEAFEANRVIILVNDRQAESLDEEFEVRPDTAVTFLRLTPLVGG
jgi:hypothetical protein